MFQEGFLKSTITLVVLLALSAALAWGQATAQIHGVVQDATGAAVPGATVKATETDTGATRTVLSGSDGGFVLNSLPLGPYSIEITKAGFATAVESGVVLQVDSDPSISISLRVG